MEILGGLPRHDANGNATEHKRKCKCRRKGNREYFLFLELYYRLCLQLVSRVKIVKEVQMQRHVSKRSYEHVNAVEISFSESQLKTISSKS